MTDRSQDPEHGPTGPIDLNRLLSEWQPDVREAFERKMAADVEAAGKSGVLTGVARVQPFVEAIKTRSHEQNVLRLELLKSELEQVSRVVLLAAGIAGVVLPLITSQVPNLDPTWLRAAAYALVTTIAVGLARQVVMRRRTDTEIAAQDEHAGELIDALSTAVMTSEVDAFLQMGRIGVQRVESKATAARSRQRHLLLWDVLLYAPLAAAVLFLLWSLPLGGR